MSGIVCLMQERDSLQSALESSQKRIRELEEALEWVSHHHNSVIKDGSVYLGISEVPTIEEEGSTPLSAIQAAMKSKATKGTE